MESAIFVFSFAHTAKNYELPKLLIREGSPIESFHSSDTQLETLAVRCDSPKSVLNTLTSLDSTSATNRLDLAGANRPTVDESVADHGDLDALIYDHANNLELTGFHDRLINNVNDTPLISCNGSANSSCEVLHNATTNGQLSQLNEFHAMFGSSPTLMNHSTIATGGGGGGGGGSGGGNGSVGTGARCLDTIPLKYRRGYSNLNDACLSSSTSNLECAAAGRAAKHSTKSNQSAKDHPSHLSLGGQETANAATINDVFSFLCRSNGTTTSSYVRSYEHLDRTKAVFGGSRSDKQMPVGSTNYGYTDGNEHNYRPPGQSDSGGASQAQHWRYAAGFSEREEDEARGGDRCATPTGPFGASQPDRRQPWCNLNELIDNADDDEFDDDGAPGGSNVGDNAGNIPLLRRQIRTAWFLLLCIH